MSTIQMTALNKAMSLLNAIGAQYAILHADTKHGDLELAPPPVMRRAKPTMFHNLTKHKYDEALAAAKVGDVLSFVCDSDEEAESLRGSISSHAISRFGHGAVMTEFKRDTDKTVKVLAVKK